MRRTIAGTAASLVALVTIGGPLAAPGYAAPGTLHCGSDAVAEECALLDDLASQLGPVAPLLGTALAPVTGDALDLAARSDSAAGVPTTEVLQVSGALLDSLDSLPAPVQKIVGATVLGDITGTLDALIGSLTAPASGSQQSAAGSGATPARTTSSSPAASLGSARSTSEASAPAAPGGGAASSDSVPAAPVGDPLTLAPLALPDFGFDQAFAPAAPVAVTAPSAEDVQLAALEDAIDRDGGRTAELAVVAVMSLLLLAAAGIAQLQANRHQIPG